MPTPKTTARIHALTEKQIDRKIWPWGIGTYTPRGLSDAFTENEIRALMTHPQRTMFGRSVESLIWSAEGRMIEEACAE